MSELQIYITLAVFGGVILAIAFDVVDMAVAALLGVSALVGLGILHESSIVAAMKTAGGPLLLLFGGMVGGNATLIGSAANVVAAGICARNGKPITFAQWLRYGIPFTVCQLAVSALYVLALSRLIR